MDIEHVIFEPRKNIYFSTYPPPTLIHLSHCFTSESKPAAQKSFACCFSHFCTSVSTSSSSAKHLPPRWFLGYQTDGSHWGPSAGCKVDVQEVPTVVLELSPGLLRLHGV
jgi:hypothetical protein